MRAQGKLNHPESRYISYLAQASIKSFPQKYIDSETSFLLISCLSRIKLFPDILRLIVSAKTSFNYYSVAAVKAISRHVPRRTNVVRVRCFLGKQHYSRARCPTVNPSYLCTLDP